MIIFGSATTIIDDYWVDRTKSLLSEILVVLNIRSAYF